MLHENRIYSHGEEENLVRIMKVNCNSGDVISQQKNCSQIYNNYCRYLNELYWTSVQKNKKTTTWAAVAAAAAKATVDKTTQTTENSTQTLGVCVEMSFISFDILCVIK